MFLPLSFGGVLAIELLVPLHIRDDALQRYMSNGPHLVRLTLTVVWLASISQAVYAQGEGTGVAAVLWRELRGEATPSPALGYGYRVTLGDGAQVELGVAYVTALDDTVVQWQADDVFIPISLWGAGFERDFLYRLINELKQGREFARAFVKEPSVRDESGRKRYADTVQLYREQGFELESRSDPPASIEARSDAAAAEAPKEVGCWMWRAL